MTGMETADETAAVSSQSNPLRVPSRSIEVSRISPAPRSAADRQRNEYPRGHLTDRCGQRAASFERGGHVEDNQLVNPFDVVAARKRSRIAGIRQAFELHTFDDTSISDIETRDDAFGQHGSSVIRKSRDVAGQ